MRTYLSVYLSLTYLSKEASIGAPRADLFILSPWGFRAISLIPCPRASPPIYLILPLRASPTTAPRRALEQSGGTPRTFNRRPSPPQNCLAAPGVLQLIAFHPHAASPRSPACITWTEIEADFPVGDLQMLSRPNHQYVCICVYLHRERDACVCVYIYIYMYVYMYIYIYIYV